MNHMTPGDAARLLALAQAFDRRTVGEADAASWADALHDLTVNECAEAIRAHYRESDAWLMPVHVRQRVKALRNAQADQRHDLDLRREIEAGKAVDRGRVRELAQTVIKDVCAALGVDRRTESHPALAVRCPYCAAQPGRACVNSVTEKERVTPHPGRISAIQHPSNRLT